jgi:Holliday junction resolvase RusA-like endonuclease
MIFHSLIPYPPTINNYYLTNKYSNKKFINPKACEYIERAKQILVQSMYKYLLAEIDYGVDIYIYVKRPDNRKRDKDNIQKCLFDTIQKAGVIKDDSLFLNEFVIDLGVDENKAGWVIVVIVAHAPQRLIDELINYYNVD